MSKQPTKWKTWHKVLLGVLLVVFFAIGKLVEKTKPDAASTATSLTQAQKDSIALEKTIEKGKVEAEVNLRTYIKQRLNDPKSFDVINQKTWAVNNTIIVMIEYTAKNEFGGVVKNNIKAEADINGKLTKVFPSE